MALLATASDTALIVIAAFWGLLVLGLLIVLVNTFRVLESTKMTIDTMREETVPLLREVKGSVERANRELDRVDTMLVSANDIVGRVEKLSGPRRAGRRQPARQGDQLRRRSPQGRRQGQGRPQEVKRGFWVALGLGAGATGAILASRWTKKQAQRVAPTTSAREAKGGLLDLSKLVSESIARGQAGHGGARSAAPGRQRPARVRRPPAA